MRPIHITSQLWVRILMILSLLSMPRMNLLADVSRAKSNGKKEIKRPTLPKSANDIRLAVLEFRDEAQLPPFERALLADNARGAALSTPFQVMTKENMIALLRRRNYVDGSRGATYLIDRCRCPQTIGIVSSM